MIPHTRNNADQWVLFSDDLGATWSKATQIADVVKQGWNWIGTGPPGSIQLQNTPKYKGRIVVPAYHAKDRGNAFNNIAHGYSRLCVLMD